MTIRRIASSVMFTALLASGIATASPAASAAATDFKYFVTHSAGTCDTATGEWVIDWEITNASDEAAALTDVVSLPASSPATSLPASVAGGETVHAAQRIQGTGGRTASLSYTARWADGSTYPSSWQFRPPAPCATTVTADAQDEVWPILDANGTQRSSLVWDTESLSGTACYGGPNGDVRIEALFDTGQNQVRVVPQFGCAVVMAYAGTGRIVAVRGLVGDFANEWHQVG